jgi:hypothetical protein
MTRTHLAGARLPTPSAAPAAPPPEKPPEKPENPDDPAVPADTIAVATDLAAIVENG